jgi:hypothetical protein
MKKCSSDERADNVRTYLGLRSKWGNSIGTKTHLLTKTIHPVSPTAESIDGLELLALPWYSNRKSALRSTGTRDLGTFD